MDIIYLYKKAPQSGIALRFSLRSISHIPHDKVYVIGDRPKWLTGVIHIPFQDIENRSLMGQWEKIIMACKMGGVSQKFLLMHDDHLIMKPIKDILYYHRGYISDIKKNKTRHYHDLKRTGELFDKALSFDKIHTPVVFDKDKFLALLDNYNIKNRYLYKSLYGNHYGVESEYIKDCKARNFSILMQKLRDGDIFISLSPAVEKNKNLKKILLKYFPKKSPHEKVDIF